MSRGLPDRPAGTPLLDIVEVARDFRLPRETFFGRTPRLRALHGVSLRIAAGESLGLIGESGSGKSTLARIAVALDRPDFGTVRFAGTDLFSASRRVLRPIRRHLQMVFQDPYGSLDPRHRIDRIISEPARHLMPREPASANRTRVSDALQSVGLRASDAERYPHEFSGGQRQRIAIARALITDPELIVADEPVSALDVSVQAQVLNLMRDLSETRGLTYLFISHDLSVVQLVTRRVAVLYLGRVVEEGTTSEVFRKPRHPYTAALIAAVPRPDPSRRRRPSRVTPEPIVPTFVRHCPYAPRCERARDRCRSEMPPLEDGSGDHRVACFYPLD